MRDGDLSVIRKIAAHDLMQVYVRLALLMAVVWFSVQTFAPFLALMLWSVILAISLFPLNQWLSAHLHLSEGTAAIVFIVIAALIVGGPMIALGVSLADHARDWMTILNEQSFQIPEAKPEVADWPVIGPALFDLWARAHEDLMSAAQMIRPQLISGGRMVLGAAANTLLVLLLFFVALLVAGFMMAHAARGTVLTRQLLGTLASHERGDEIQALIVATVRSVSNGVVGVAFLQALALGLGFLALDVPAAGVLALLVLFLGVLQLPSSLVVLPAIAWVWLSGDGGNLGNTVGTAYLLLAGLGDGLLKPYLLGKGVDTPVSVVLIGALGGMAAEGLVGLFVGAVMLSVGYRLLMSWVEQSVAEHEALEKSGAAPDP